MSTFRMIKVYEWVLFFFKGQVYEWGWFRNASSTPVPKLPSK